MIDGFREILENLQRHRVRTILTALSVAWGVLMLVVLLGFGNGLQNSFQTKFADDATNSIWLHRGTTALPYAGMKIGRSIEFTNQDYDMLRNIPGVEKLTGRYYMWEDYAVKYKNKSSGFSIRAVHPDHLYLEKTIMLQGRYINDFDIKHKRKVAVIGPVVVDILFGKENALGKNIMIGNSVYRVIGLFTDDGQQNEQKKIFIPVTTAQQALHAGDTLHALLFTVGNATIQESKDIFKRVKTALAKVKKFDPEDPKVLRTRNNVEDFQQITQIFDLIKFVIWMVGLGTLVSGVVGVSNIMIINVSERRKEIGIRKALGATPWSIVSAIVLEAVFLTAFAGYLGILGGIGILELAGMLLEHADHIKDPQVDIRIVLGATGMLVLFGTMAGAIPAFRAAKIPPVEALRA